MAWVVPLIMAAGAAVNYAQNKSGQDDQEAANRRLVSAQQKAGQAAWDYRKPNHDARMVALQQQLNAYSPMRDFLGSNQSLKAVDPFAGTNWSADGPLDVARKQTALNEELATGNLNAQYGDPTNGKSAAIGNGGIGLQPLNSMLRNMKG